MVQREVADRFFAAAEHEGVRRRLGARPARDRAHRLPSRSRARSSGRRRTSTRRSSPSGATGCRESYRRRQAGRRGGVRPPAQDASELARARGRRDRARGGGGARGDRPDPRRPRRSARAARVRRADRALAPMKRGSTPGEDQPRARRRPAPAGRQARGRDRPPAGRPRRPDRARAGARRSRRRASPEDTLVRARCSQLAAEGGGRRAALARDDREADPGRGRARRRKLGRRRRARLANETLPSRSSRRAAASSSPPTLGADVPFFLTDGPQLGTGDGTRAGAARPAAGLLGPARCVPDGADEGVDGRGLRRVRRRDGRTASTSAGAAARRAGASRRETSPRCRRTTSPPRRSPTSSRARGVPRRRQRRRPGRLRALRPRPTRRSCGAERSRRRGALG